VLKGNSRKRVLNKINKLSKGMNASFKSNGKNK